MQKTTTALIATLTMIAVLLLPLAVHDVHQAITTADSRATSAQQATVVPAAVETTDEHAVCMTDAECAQWDAQGYTMPNGAYDPGAELSCPASMDLYDTENPDLGSSGVVCRPV